MMFAVPAEEYHANPVMVKVLKKLLILHADHEQNCSTSTVRLVGSSHANLYASVAAGIDALWGPLHGGANQAVIEMLEAIRDDGGDVAKFVARAKDPNDSFRLMGFGHRVYKTFDPRAKVIKDAAGDVLAQLDHNDELLDIASSSSGWRSPTTTSSRRSSTRTSTSTRHHLPGDGLPDRHIHGPVRHRPVARVDRPLARDDQRPLRPASAVPARCTPASRSSYVPVADR
jgi:hypothetical protein